MTESMIVRGAEAMKAKRRELIAQPLDRIWPDLMRAAIEALREPTEAMVDAGAECPIADEDQGNLAGEARTIFAAMIDAALSEKP